MRSTFSKRDPHFTPKRTRTDPGASFTRRIIPTGRNGKWDITENADRFRLLMGASKAECPFQIAPPTQRKHMAACPRSCTCSHLPHLETPTTHFIVMSFLHVRCCCITYLTLIQRDDAYLILSRASLIHETDVMSARYHIMMRNTAVGRAGYHSHLISARP